MTHTEKLITEKKLELQEYIKNQVQAFKDDKTKIWSNLMEDISPKIIDFENNVTSTFSSEFGNDFKKQISHYFEMRKHLKEINEYYDNLIKELSENSD
ncbi:hypothetical protein F3C99_11295 [Vitellibacter sp. q18]|nr:hypothetical protein [Aequorivita lutea]